MLAKVLAVLVALGSVSWYGLAWTFPALSRRYDVILAGAGLFYGLVLWVCAGQVTGAIALGQFAILGLLGALAYQVLQLRSGATEEMAALPQGAGMLALVGAVRSRLTGLKAAPLQLKLTGSVGEEIEEKQEKQGKSEAIAVPDMGAKSTEVKATKTAETSESKSEPKADVDVTPAKPAKGKAVKPKKASQPVATGKGVYQRKKVRKFDRGEGKTGAKSTGQPVYQRKKVRKFDAEEGTREKTREKKEAIAQPKSTKPAAKAQPDVAPPAKAPEVKAPAVAALKVKPAAIATLAIDVDGDFWEMAAIAPELLLVSEIGAAPKMPAVENPWTTPPMDPEELTFGVAQKIAEDTAKEIAIESEAKKSQPKKSQPQTAPQPEPADTNWPDDGDTNWPDDGDTNWPKNPPAQAQRKPRRKSRSPVIKGEVVSRLPRRPVILQAELIKDDD
ncbi:MAG: Ycf66 family protein [Cyanobacteria bacterium P01_C01_bin.89]